MCHLGCSALPRRAHQHWFRTSPASHVTSRSHRGAAATDSFDCPPPPDAGAHIQGRGVGGTLALRRAPAIECPLSTRIRFATIVVPVPELLKCTYHFVCFGLCVFFRSFITARRISSQLIVNRHQDRPPPAEAVIGTAWTPVSLVRLFSLTRQCCARCVPSSVVVFFWRWLDA